MTNKIVAPNLYIKEIADLYIRTNFENLADYFAAQNQLLGFKFFEINETAAVTNKVLTHNLGFLPKDIIQSTVYGTGALLWNYSKFSITTVTYSTTGPVRYRFFLGTYNGDTSTVQFPSSSS